MTDLEKLKEQICGKEPKREDFASVETCARAIADYKHRTLTFDATAAAMLELVKGKMPDAFDECGMLKNAQHYKNEAITAIQSLQNNDNGKRNDSNTARKP